MLDLPTPILGEVTAFTIATANLEESFKYYSQLGFSEVLRFGFPFPWIQVSDGAVLIMLREEKKDIPYIALTYYTKHIDSVVAGLRAKGIKFTFEPKENDMLKRYIFQSPDGFNISIIYIFDGFKQPPGPTMLRMEQGDYFNPDKYVNKTCGMFGEYAQPVKDLNVSIAFWEKLGFKVVSKFSSPYDWAILSDGISVVGLHQSNHFTKPTLTYFAADMKEKMDHLVANGLKDYKEVMGGNYVLNTPEEQNINLFKMGM